MIIPAAAVLAERKSKEAAQAERKAMYARQKAEQEKRLALLQSGSAEDIAAYFAERYKGFDVAGMLEHQSWLFEGERERVIMAAAEIVKGKG